MAPMKILFQTHLAFGLALIAIISAIAACKPKNPALGGDWQYNGQACRIIQNQDQLMFVNEKGDRSRGHFLNSTNVIATDWERGLVGDLTGGGKRINWRNQTVWIKAP